MPVYIRKNVSYTPPSVDKPPPEDEDDFINDPELIRDDLPQPYRMIDKVLSGIIDDSWDEISQREAARLEEARKVRPPDFEYSMCLEGPIPGTPFPEKQVYFHFTSLVRTISDTKFCVSSCILLTFHNFFFFIWIPFSSQEGIRQQNERDGLCLLSVVLKIQRGSTPTAPMA